MGVYHETEKDLIRKSGASMSGIKRHKLNESDRSDEKYDHSSKSTVLLHV